MSYKPLVILIPSVLEETNFHVLGRSRGHYVYPDRVRICLHEKGSPTTGSLRILITKKRSRTLPQLSIGFFLTLWMIFKSAEKSQLNFASNHYSQKGEQQWLTFETQGNG